MTGRPASDRDLAATEAEQVDKVRDVRAEWERGLAHRSASTTSADPVMACPAPTRVRAAGAVGHVRLSWDCVPGAAGYLIEQTEGEDGRPRILNHGGSDVPAVPSNEFAVTGLQPDTDYHYRIGAVTGAEYPTWAWSDPVSARPLVGPAEPVEVRVDASRVVGRLSRVWHMVGSERLSQLTLSGDEQWIGTEFATALKLAHDDLGVSRVRAHGILHDDNQVVQRDEAGRITYRFDKIDAIYDRLLEIGIRPIVELSFMPDAMASDPEQTVFTYRGIISPPKDWGEWRELVATLAAHLVERYGIDEVASWAFEVWNEPNLEVFWSGTKGEYLRLYDESVSAIKGVDRRLQVGGPSTAAGEWVEALAAHASHDDKLLDFVSTHTYGNLPLDVRPALRRNGFDRIPIWWTEWGVGSTHFGPIHDRVTGAPFVLSGFATAQGRVDALAYWVVSDHFEELGRPARLFHDGFGLLTVGNLRKPRYWAVHLAAHLGDDLLESQVEGDGAGVLVQAWATVHDNGTLDVLVWNGTINAELMAGDPRLNRDVRLTITGLGDMKHKVSLARIDEQHSNIVALCPTDVQWPDEALWTELRAHDDLYEETLPDTAAKAHAAEFNFAVPMPGVARIRLSPAPPHQSTGTQ